MTMIQIDLGVQNDDKLDFFTMYIHVSSSGILVLFTFAHRYRRDKKYTHCFSLVLKNGIKNISNRFACNCS